MKKAKQLHLWIGLICSIFILMESITGLLMNEPWLIGQTSMEGGKGNFQQGQFTPPTQQGTTTNSTQAAGQIQGQANGQSQNSTTAQTNGQTNNGSQNGMTANGQFGGRGSFPGGEGGQGTTSITGIIRGLHAGRIGNTSIKWLVDLTAIAMIFLTITGIYLSVKVLGANRKRKNNRAGRSVA